jgi:hypothetical protein
MEKERNGKNLIIAALLITVVSLSVAFAATLSSSLSINGTANISEAKWNVHFASATKTEESTLSPKEGFNVSNNLITYSVDLEENKYLEFDAVIKNEGTYDAKLSSLELAGITGYEDLITYTTSGLNVDSTIAAGSSATITVKVAMGTITNDTIKLIPEDGVSLDLTLVASFVQA